MAGRKSCCIIPIAAAQYTSEVFPRLTAEGVKCSLSRSGDLWDNAAMQSFFSSLKVERVALQNLPHEGPNQSRCVEGFYNPRRRHSTIGYVSPIEFEQRVLLA